MSFPYMNTNLFVRLVFNKQERGKCFTGSYVLSLYEYKSHKETCIQQASRQEIFSQGLMSFPYMNTNLLKRLVLNKQADKRKSKGRQGVRKGDIFHRVLCPFLI